MVEVDMKNREAFVHDLEIGIQRGIFVAMAKAGQIL